MTLGGVLRTSSQNKKQIFSRQTHVSKNCGNTTAILLSKTEKKQLVLITVQKNKI